MKQTSKYRGYTGQYRQSSDGDGMWQGEVLGIADVLTFAAPNDADIEDAFRATVDDYLEWAENDGFAALKP